MRTRDGGGGGGRLAWRRTIWRTDLAALSEAEADTESWRLLAAAEALGPARVVHGSPDPLPGQDWTCDVCLAEARTLGCTMTADETAAVLTA